MVPKFLVLYRSPTSAADQMAGATPEQAQAGMDAWMAWAGRAGDGIVDLGAPLGESRTLGDAAGDAHVTGFSILQADSGDAAAGLLDGHPHLSQEGNSIDVREFLPIPGM
jgi:hypothetical protein